MNIKCNVFLLIMAKMYSKSGLDNFIKEKKRKLKKEGRKETDYINDIDAYNSYKKIEKELMDVHRVSDALEILAKEEIPATPSKKSEKNNFWDLPHFFTKEYVDGKLFEDFREFYGKIVIDYFIIDKEGIVYKIEHQETGINH